MDASRIHPLNLRTAESQALRDQARVAFRSAMAKGRAACRAKDPAKVRAQAAALFTSFRELESQATAIEEARRAHLAANPEALAAFQAELAARR